MSDMPRGSLAELRTRLTAVLRENHALRERLCELERRLSLQSAATRILAEPRGEVPQGVLRAPRVPEREQ